MLMREYFRTVLPGTAQLAVKRSKNALFDVFAQAGYTDWMIFGTSNYLLLGNFIETTVALDWGYFYILL